MIRNELLSQAAGIKTNRYDLIKKIKRSLIRLLQIACCPTAAAQAILNDGPQNPVFGSLCERVISDGPGPKILKTCSLVRENVNLGRKTVVWSTFRHTIASIRRLLPDLGAEALHGGVPAGPPDDPETKEAIIRRFHLIAIVGLSSLTHPLAVKGSAFTEHVMTRYM